jgi:hypothetical protein
VADSARRTRRISHRGTGRWPPARSARRRFAYR